jgi:hypothetical protein
MDVVRGRLGRVQRHREIDLPDSESDDEESDGEVDLDDQILAMDDDYDSVYSTTDDDDE